MLLVVVAGCDSSGPEDPPSPPPEAQVQEWAIFGVTNEVRTYGLLVRVGIGPEGCIDALKDTVYQTDKNLRNEQQLFDLLATDEGTLLASFQNLGVYRSTDIGDTWERVSETAFQELFKTPSGRLFGWRPTSEAYVTEDDGASWKLAAKGEFVVYDNDIIEVKTQNHASGPARLQVFAEYNVREFHPQPVLFEFDPSSNEWSRPFVVPEEMNVANRYPETPACDFEVEEADDFYYDGEEVLISGEGRTVNCNRPLAPFEAMVTYSKDGGDSWSAYGGPVDPNADDSLYDSAYRIHNPSDTKFVVDFISIAGNSGTPFYSFNPDETDPNDQSAGWEEYTFADDGREFWSCDVGSWFQNESVRYRVFVSAQ